MNTPFTGYDTCPRRGPTQLVQAQAGEPTTRNTRYIGISMQGSRDISKRKKTECPENVRLYLSHRYLSGLLYGTS